MPENETLVFDARVASRWRPIGERLDKGETPTELFLEMQNQFYTSLQRTWKQWRDRGVDPAQLFDAGLNDPKALSDLIKKLSFDPNARLLREVAADSQGAGMEQLVSNFLNAAWEDAENQLALDRRYEAQSLEFIGQVHQMLSRITRSVSNNRSRIPNRPSQNEPPLDLDARLNQSLL